MAEQYIRMLSLSITIATMCCLSVTSAAEDRFFPLNSFDKEAKHDAFVENWYSKHLQAMGEVPLFPPSLDAKIYRFTWLRTFHHPMVFRLVVKSDGSGVLYSTESSGQGGYEPGVKLNSSNVQLSILDVVEVERQLKEFDFWHMSPTLDERGMDGAEWIFEASVNGNYHFVTRNTPLDTKYANTMLGLMRRSGMNLGEIY